MADHFDDATFLARADSLTPEQRYRLGLPRSGRPWELLHGSACSLVHKEGFCDCGFVEGLIEERDRREAEKAQEAKES